MTVDSFRNAPPDNRSLDAGLAQDLGHLGDVPEHIGQVANDHSAAQLPGALPAEAQVADDRLPGDQKLVQQHLPWSNCQAATRHQAPDSRLSLRTDVQVVVDRRELAVEGETKPLVRLELIEDSVDRLDQAHAENLEGQIPLAVPVGVRAEHDVGGIGHWISPPRSIERSPDRDRNIMESTAGVQMVSIAPPTWAKESGACPPRSPMSPPGPGSPRPRSAGSYRARHGSAPPTSNAFRQRLPSWATARPEWLGRCAASKPGRSGSS